MMGRESGREGDFKTAEYIASEFRRLGLEPAGENGTYFQTVPFWTTAVDPLSRLDVGGSTLQLSRDFLPASIAAPRRELAGVDVVYGGSLGDPATVIGPDQAADKLVVLIPRDASLRGVRIDQPRFARAKAVAVALLENLPPEFTARLRDGRPVADTTRRSASPRPPSGSRFVRSSTACARCTSRASTPSATAPTTTARAR